MIKNRTSEDAFALVVRMRTASMCNASPAFLERLKKELASWGETIEWELLRHTSHAAQLCEKARMLGESDGAGAVELLFGQHGPDALASTLEPGRVTWAEAARNAKAHTYARGSAAWGPEQVDAYYEGYAKAAQVRIDEFAEICAQSAAQTC